MKKLSLIILLFYAILWSIFPDRTRSHETRHAPKAFRKISKTDKPARFFEFHQGIRTRDGEAAPRYHAGYKIEALQRARQHAAARRRSSGGRIRSNGVLGWTERGPGNVPGRTRALLNVAGDPANNTWLAGSATGGIWRTADGGATWTEKSADFPALAISSFASTTDGAVIYAGTGEFISSVFSSIGDGIFRSTDRGETWQQLPATRGRAEFAVVTRLIVNPDDPATIVATTVSHSLSSDNSSSIMRSADGGTTWTKVKTIQGVFEQIIATPQNFAVQYAAQKGAGVWKSTDAGMTWALSNTGMTPGGRVELDVSRVNPNILFAAAEGTLSGTESDLYYSADAGASWSLVDVSFASKTVDFFEGQGFYDNVVMCDPFNAQQVYFGGVSLFRSTIGSGTSVVDTWKIRESGTEGFIFLQSFQNIAWDNARLNVGGSKPRISVQLRFGPGKSQKAHRFFVPDGATSGVPAASYSYQDYVSVPFEAWDITEPTAPRQLMVSFRDQNRNGFDLVSQNLDENTPASSHSREYVYIHGTTYSATAAGSISVDGGHENGLLYNFFPCLAAGASWPADATTSQLEIRHSAIPKMSATTVTVADGRGSFDNKNQSNQVNLGNGVHPDHHIMVPVVISQAARTFKILLGNDGGVFVSKVSANPGTVEGDWVFKGIGLNTSQFYGADKRPGKDQYLGGMQDNGTRISLASQAATAATPYVYAIGGDGFEALWNSKDDRKMLGSVYYGQISRSIDGGSTWLPSTQGLNPDDSNFPFITKLANNKDYPERVYTVGGNGVYVSEDFGGTWKLTPIPQRFVLASSFYLDVEVSRANANIVWAGSGMNPNGQLQRNLHVSTDGGATFSSTTNHTAVPLGNITKLASHPTQEQTAYALFSFSGGPKILRTTDLGQSWEDISGFGTGTASTNGFPDVAVFCLYVRPDDPDILWAGTEIGIVESTDNGVSWALLDDFPNVTVWDIKGQDNQIVIATHGRGLWTATVAADQVTGKAPEITAWGTNPQGVLALRLTIPSPCDSILFFVNGTRSKMYPEIPAGTRDFTLENVSPGTVTITAVSYSAGIPGQSAAKSFQHLQLTATKTSYATYFNTLQDIQVTGLTLKNFQETTGQRKSLQTNHPYSVNQVYGLLIRTPIRVSATMPVLFFRDIAIVEPGNDSVIVEATRNGLDWVPLMPGYDAAWSGAPPSWKEAFDSNLPGKADMYVRHEVDFGGLFAADEHILFRLRMVSGPSVTSWGWSLDYVSIQEEPLGETGLSATATVQLSVFPNPASGLVNLEYALRNASDVTVFLTDIYGRPTRLLSAARAAGQHSEKFNVEDRPNGTYLLTLHCKEGKQSRKIVINR